MIRLFGVLVIFICFNNNIASCQSLEEIILQVLEVAEEGRTNDALILLDQAIDKYPEYPMLRVLKGEVYSGYSKRLSSNESVYKVAVNEYNKALAIDSLFAPAYSARGLLNIIHQKYELAVKDFDRYLELMEDSEADRFRVLMDRGSANFYLKNYERAISDYNAALALKSDNANAYANLGSLYAQMNLDQKAEETYLQGLAFDSLNSHLLNNLGLHYVKTKRTREAIEVFQKAIAADPEEPFAYNNLGLALIKNKNPKEAITQIKQSLKIYPENSFAYKHLAMAQIMLKQKAEACVSLERAVELGYNKSYDDEVDKLLSKHCLKHKK